MIKISAMHLTSFTFFRLWEPVTRICEPQSVWGHKIFEIVSKRRAVVFYKKTQAGITPDPRYFDLSVWRNPLSKSKSHEIFGIHGTVLELWEYVLFVRFSTFNLWQKNRWRFDTVNDILRSLSLEQSLVKSRKVLICDGGNWRLCDCREPTG